MIALMPLGCEGALNGAVRVGLSARHDIHLLHFGLWEMRVVKTVPMPLLMSRLGCSSPQPKAP